PAGVLAAMIINLPPPPMSSGRRRRAIAASAIASGCRARTSARARACRSSIVLASPGQQFENLGLVRHRRRAGDLSRDDRTRGVPKPNGPLEFPSANQAEAECSAECVAGTESVHDFDGNRRDLDLLDGGSGQNSGRALFYHCERAAAVEQCLRRGGGVRGPASRLPPA